MEPQGRGSVSPLRTRRRNSALGLSKTTLRSRVHVQTVGLNAATKKDRHRAGREVCLLTFLFIGLFRLRLIGMYGPPPRRKRNLKTPQVGLRKCIRHLLEWITPGQDGMRCALFSINWSVAKD